MKQQKIYMKAWLDAHGRAKAVDTDEWYLDFANQLLPLVADSFIYGGREWEEDQKRVALTCALYLEDCVADGGNWRQFIHWHRKSYGRYLPFYALTEEYLPDEINREDVVFLLWAINSPVGDDFWSREPDGCGFAGVCGYALQPFGCCVRIGSYQRLSGNGLADGNGADAKEADASAGSFAGRKDAYERRTFP